ncbi:MAG: hypothetical protein RLZZ297_1695 [Chloroflexota bacterium]|jgi:hypothetical protein
MTIFSRPFGWYWYALLLTVWLCNVAVVQADGGGWRTESQSARISNYSDDLGRLEWTDYFGPTLGFRQLQRNGFLPLPDTVEARTVVVRVISRADDPPTSLHLESDRHQIALPLPPNLHRLHLLLPADTRYRIGCDTSAVATPYLQRICVAFVDARATALRQTSQSTAYGYILPVVAVMLLVVVALHAGRASSTLAWVVVSVAGAVVLMLMEKYGLQLISWRYGMLQLFGAAAIVIWGSERLSWRVRQPLILIVVALTLKYSGFLAPGSPGADLPVHAQQLENVMTGNLFLQNSGTLNPVAGNTAITQTYPYPPAIYLVLAPLAILFQPPFPLTSIVGAATIFLDSLFVIGLLWVVAESRLSRRTAVLAAIAYLLFPQSYVLQNYPNTAQALAQVAGWVFLVLALAQPDPRTVGQRLRLIIMAFLSIAGHFGVFITMTLVQCYTYLFGGLRKTAVYWVYTGIAVSLVYYSQYLSLILDQLQRLDSEKDATPLQAALTLWYTGIDDHYVGGAFVVALLAIGLTAVARRPLLRQIWWSTVAASATLAVLRVGFSINPTRFVILLTPFFALGIAMMSQRYLQSRAGRWMVYFFYISLITVGLMTWYTLKIDHDMIRWSLPQ